MKKRKYHFGGEVILPAKLWRTNGPSGRKTVAMSISI
jgi:hypothetical protein